LIESDAANNENMTPAVNLCTDNGFADFKLKLDIEKATEKFCETV